MRTGLADELWNKGSIGRPGVEWEDNIQKGYKKKAEKTWNEFGTDWHKLKALLDTMTKFQFPYSAEKL